MKTQETPKQQAMSRVRRKYLEFTKKREIQEQSAHDYDNKIKSFRAMIATEGWKFLIQDLELKIAELQNKESEVSSFRVFTCMELKNQIKNLKNLKNSLLKAEKLGLMVSIKD